MARPLVPNELWEVVQPLLPRHRARPGRRGRPPVDDRACLTGIVFVLHSGIPWEKLLHALLQRVGQEQGIDWDNCCVDSQSFRAVFGGSSPAKIPRIGPKKAPNGTCSSMAKARPWP